MRWDELNWKEQKIANKIESILLNNPHTITKKEFLKATFFIGNKHQKKSFIT